MQLPQSGILKVARQSLITTGTIYHHFYDVIFALFRQKFFFPFFLYSELLPGVSLCSNQALYLSNLPECWIMRENTVYSPRLNR